MDTPNIGEQIGPEIGKGAVATVHTYGPHVLKLWIDPAAKHQAFIEAQNLALAATHSLPVPAVHAVGQYEGRWGLVMSRVTGDTLANQLKAAPETLGPCLDAMATLHRALHAKSEPRLRPLKPKLAAAVKSAEQLDTAHKTRLIARLETLPDGQSLCHGDFHPYNLIGPPEALTIIDWLDATSGPTAADVCRSAVILSIVGADLAADYIARYTAKSDLTTEDINAWRPIIAAARLRENPADVENLVKMASEI